MPSNYSCTMHTLQTTSLGCRAFKTDVSRHAHSHSPERMAHRQRHQVNITLHHTSLGCMRQGRRQSCLAQRGSGSLRTNGRRTAIVTAAAVADEVYKRCARCKCHRRSLSSLVTCLLLRPALRSAADHAYSAVQRFGEPGSHSHGGHRSRPRSGRAPLLAV